MVIVKVSAPVLQDSKRRDARFRHWRNIRFHLFRTDAEQVGSKRCQYLFQRLKLEQSGGGNLCVEAQWMSCTPVAFNRSDMVREFPGMSFCIPSPAAQAALFIHPCDHSDGSLRVQMQLDQKLRCIHRDGHSSGVVDRAGAEIPGIEVPGNDNHLLRMLAAFQIRNNVVARNLWKKLWREREMQPHRPLLHQVRDQFGIFRSDCAGGDSSGNTVSRVGYAIVRPAYGAHQRRRRSHRRRRFRALPAVLHRLSVSLPPMAGVSLASIELHIEQNDLARNLIPAQRLQVVEAADHNNFTRQSLRRRSRTSAQRGHDHFLLCPRCLTWPLRQFSGLCAAYPMRNHHLLQPRIQASLAQRIHHMMRRRIGLR